MNRKVITAILLSGWFVLLAMSIISSAEEPDSEANPLSLHLEVVSDNANHSEQQTIVQLTAKNEGTEPLLLPRLQEGFLEKYGWWWGWHINILLRHPKEEKYEGSFQYIDSRQELLMLREQGKLTEEELDKFFYLSEKDLFTLLPRETLAVHINLANAKQYDKDRGCVLRQLQDTPGVYEVSASLVLYAGNAPEWYLQKGWSGHVESNTLKVIVENKSDQQRTNTKK